ncbi:MAG: HAD family phosphatase [Limnothrix sp.]
MSTIEAIIFDLGGCIINIDYPRTILAFNALHKADISVPYSQDDQADLFDAFEMGAISAIEFRQELREILGIECDDPTLDQAWNAMLLDIPLQRIELLEALAQQKRLFLLANSNEIHRAAIKDIFQKTCGHQYASLDELFEQTYYSHQMGDRKPNPSMFKQVLDAQNLEPNQTLIIDDKAANIKAAEELGLQTFHLMKGKSLMNLAWLKTN